VPAPVIFAKPAEGELPPDPIPAHWVIEGTPQVRSKRVATSADGTAMVMVWSCTPGTFKWHYTGDEMLHIIAGEVFVTNEKGEVRRLGPGDMAFFPAGSISIWRVTKDLRKVAMCRHSMPRPLGFLLRAWNKLVDILTGFSAGRIEPVRLPAARPDAGRVSAA
jgi:uncharacterized cupin superfamily protein